MAFAMINRQVGKIMRYGIPLLGNRVAPRCTCADSVLLIALRRNRVSKEDSVDFPSHSLFDLIELLSEYRVDTLVCGGISRENKEILQARSVRVIDNVACTIDETIEALKTGILYSGYGLNGLSDGERGISDTNQDKRVKLSTTDGIGDDKVVGKGIKADCIACSDRVCLRGDPCEISSDTYANVLVKEISRIQEAALDIACEQERTLCRLSELIYFCLEMRYKRLGLAYCIDLQEPAEILTQVLRRFFDVFPVCCKVGGISIDDSFYLREVETVKDSRRKQIACNPRGQAAILNKLGTDLNIIAGICMGADCIFARASEAPVTTLLVKDRSLANNPIGALYSDYYLSEAAMASAHKGYSSPVNKRKIIRRIVWQFPP